MPPSTTQQSLNPASLLSSDLPGFQGDCLASCIPSMISTSLVDRACYEQLLHYSRQEYRSVDMGDKSLDPVLCHATACLERLSSARDALLESLQWMDQQVIELRRSKLVIEDIQRQPYRVFTPLPLDVGEQIIGMAAAQSKTDARSLSLVSKVIQGWYVIMKLVISPSLDSP